MCYERLRAEACVDYSAHHALVNAGERDTTVSYQAEGTGAHVCPARGCCKQLAPASSGMDTACAKQPDQIARLALFYLEAGRGKAFSMPAAARPHCILHTR
jgi:hypothetical protein